MLKLLHISDTHFGAKFGFLGEASGQHRQRLLNTFSKSVDLAIENEVDAMILTGDIFDHYYPDRSLMIEFNSRIQPLIEKSIYVIVLPGNHDRLEEGCVWGAYYDNLPQERDTEYKKFVKILTEGHEYIDELNTHVWGNAISSQRSKHSPLEGIAEKIAEERAKPTESGVENYFIALAHGSVDIGRESQNHPIRKEEIGQLGADYLALGDWHGVLDVSQAQQKAYYAGSLEVLMPHQTNSGFALLVEVEDTVKVTPIKVSELKLVEKVFNLSQTSLESVLTELRMNRGEDVMLTVKLEGSIDREQRKGIDVEDLLDKHKRDYYFLKIVDKSSGQMSVDEINKYPKGSVPREFADLVAEKLKNKEISEEIGQKILILGMQTILDEN